MRTDPKQKWRESVFLENAIYFFLLAAVFLLPLHEKSSVLLVEAAVLLALSDNALSGKWKMRTPLAFWLFAAFILWAGYTLQNSPDFAASLYNYRILMPQYFFLYWLVVSYVKTPRQLYAMTAVFLLSAFVVACYGIYQYFYVDMPLPPEWVDQTRFANIKTRVFSTLHNPNILGAFLVSAFALTFGFFIAKTDIIYRAASFILLAAFSLCMIFTFSRAAWLCSLLIVLLGCIFYNRKLLLFIVPAVFAAAFYERALLMERFLSAFEGTDSSSALRMALWESTRVMIERHPFSGIGWGAYRFVYPEYDFFINDSSVIIYHAHNIFLHYAAELGLTGLAIFLLFFLCTLYYALKSTLKIHDKNMQALARGLCGVFIAVLLGGLTDHTLFSSQMMSVFLVLSGLSYCVYKNDNFFRQ